MKVRCQDCGWTGEESTCDAITHLHERVAAGEPMPAGQCRECGALCHEDKCKRVDVTIVATILADDVDAAVGRINHLLDFGTVQDSFSAADVDLGSILVTHVGEPSDV